MKDGYEVGSDGTVYSLTRRVRFVHPISGKECFRTHKGMPLSLQVDDAGYRVATIGNKRYRVHRLVAMAFLPNPQGLPVVKHLNNDKGDNRVSNLAWSTREENMRDAWRDGIIPVSTSITQQQVDHAIDCIEGGASLRAAARSAGMSNSYLSVLLSGKSVRTHSPRLRVKRGAGRAKRGAQC